MALRLHDTLSGETRPFVPLRPGRVGLYVCGVTVYDRSHIGHARALVAFDVLVRYLRFAGYAVTFVRNFTDVDDKIIRRAAERGVSIQELTDACIADFHADMQALRCLPPTHQPRATDHIPDMLDLIRELEAKGLAYAVDGDVYYAVEGFGGYGKLAHRGLDDMAAGARIEVDPRKRHPMDFALWKAAKPGEPAWDSPWGSGRPGWHIECSAMSSGYLGQPFDIHGGGADLIFPHHENEIAQSEGARGCALARFWLHNGMVTVEGEKMSKSLGNFLTIGDALQRVATPEVLRFVLLSSHYRMPLDFAAQKLDDAHKGLTRAYETLARAEVAAGGPSEPDGPSDDDFVARFREAMDDDCNTPRALGVIFDGVRELNRALDAGRTEAAAGLRRTLGTVGAVLGLLEEPPGAFLDAQKQSGLADGGLAVEEIEALVAERAAARAARDFGRADAIRDRLAGCGIVLKDGPDGTTWTVQ